MYFILATPFSCVVTYVSWKVTTARFLIFSLFKNKDNYPGNLVFQLLKSEEITICWDDLV